MESDTLRVLSLGTVEYRKAHQRQLDTHADVVAGRAPPTLLLLEHPPVYTLGKRGGEGFFLKTQDELRTAGADVIRTDRGGLVTFHGPGQLVGYPIVDLGRVKTSLTEYVETLLDVLVEALAEIGLAAEADMDQPGVYVQGRKIAAVGVRLSRNVTRHGFAVNLTTDLKWFDNIVACGLEGVTVTSVEAELGAAPDPARFGRSISVLLAERLGLSLTLDPAPGP